MRLILRALPFLLAASVAQAQDASILGGKMSVRDSDQDSFAVQLGYAQRTGDHTAISAEYVNEGHPNLHHRDGLSLQFWTHTLVPEQGWSFATGIGPYYYFDTTTGTGLSADYRNDHGWGAMASLSAKYHFAARTYVEVKASRIKGRSGHDSDLLLVGVGYELRDLPRSVQVENVEKGDNTLLLLRARSIVNSFNSERSNGGALEYRRTINPNLEWSLMYLNEGKVAFSERKGVATQAWLMRPFTERTVLELGVGAYVMQDKLDRNSQVEEETTHIAPIASIGIRYRFNPTLRAQLSWSRVITSYHRDSDVFLLGAGVSF